MIGHTAPAVKGTPRLGFQFRPLPVAVEPLGLPSTAAILFAILIDDAKRRGWRTRLLNPALAARLGRSVATVKRLLALLESRGLIQREHAADGRIRTATRITWDGVAHSQPTDNRTVAHSQAGGGSLPGRGVAHSRATNSESPSQSAFQTREVSTSKEETPESSPPLTAEDVRRAIADGVAGVYAPLMFDAEPTPATRPACEPTPKADAKTESPAAKPTTPARVARAEPHGGLDLRRVGVSAVAAAWSPSWGAAPKYTPADIERQLRERRRRIARAGGPSPAPSEGRASSSATSAQSEQGPVSGRDFAVRL